MSAAPLPQFVPPSGVITLLTDFGTADGFVGAMKGVILGIHPRARVIDLTHEVAPQNIAAGAFLLAAHFKYFPRGTVHVAVVDPGVGTARRALACYAYEHYFVAPDNGLLDFCADAANVFAIALTRREYWREPVSQTFHGRDVFAPVAAHLAAGVALPACGTVAHLTPQHRSRNGFISNETLRGEIIYSDRFGNLIANITPKVFWDFVGAASYQIQCAGINLGAIVRTYGEASPGAVVALFNSFDCLELGVVQGNAQKSLAIPLGTPIIIKRGS